MDFPEISATEIRELQQIPEEELYSLVLDLVERLLALIKHLNLVIFLDGLQATGKGTQLEHFDEYFDNDVETISSGIFYRVFTYLYLCNGGDTEKITQGIIQQLVKNTQIEAKRDSATAVVSPNELINPTILFLEDTQLRTEEINRIIGRIAAQPVVLKYIITQQARWVLSAKGMYVNDGRQAPYIKQEISQLPESETINVPFIVSVYLYASLEEIQSRVIGRVEKKTGQTLTGEEREEVLRTAHDRDKVDLTRSEIPALDYDGAVRSGAYDVIINTTELNPLQVFYLILKSVDQLAQTHLALLS